MDFNFLPLLSKAAALSAGRGIGHALAKKTKRVKRPQKTMQQKSRKVNRRNK